MTITSIPWVRVNSETNYFQLSFIQSAQTDREHIWNIQKEFREFLFNLHQPALKKMIWSPSQ